MSKSHYLYMRRTFVKERLAEMQTADAARFMANFANTPRSREQCQAEALALWDQHCIDSKIEVFEDCESMTQVTKPAAPGPLTYASMADCLEKMVEKAPVARERRNSLQAWLDSRGREE